MARRDELSGIVDELVATVRVRRIRRAWAEAAGHLGLEHRPAARIFDDAAFGLVEGLPVEVQHLPLFGLRRLATVIVADGCGALPEALDLHGGAVLAEYDAARETEDERAASGSVYRSSRPRDLDETERARLRGDEVAIGVSLRGGKVVYQHGAPIEDAVLLAQLIGDVARLAAVLARRA